MCSAPAMSKPAPLSRTEKTVVSRALRVPSSTRGCSVRDVYFHALPSRL
jgi:hypothetical protein